MAALKKEPFLWFSTFTRFYYENVAKLQDEIYQPQLSQNGEKYSDNQKIYNIKKYSHNLKHLKVQ